MCPRVACIWSVSFVCLTVGVPAISSVVSVVVFVVAAIAAVVVFLPLICVFVVMSVVVVVVVGVGGTCFLSLSASVVVVWRVLFGVALFDGPAFLLVAAVPRGAGTGGRVVFSLLGLLVSCRFVCLSLRSIILIEIFDGVEE